MAQALPPRPNLDWLRKSAKQKLVQLRTKNPATRLAEAQLELARGYGFSSWRSLKAHVDKLLSASAGEPRVDEAAIADFLRAAGIGDLPGVRAVLADRPAMVNAVGPHPFWGGRVQALHVAIDTNRRDVFDVLLHHGANVNGDNREYSDWSPLMLAAYKQRAGMRQALIQRGAKIGLFEALLLGDDARLERILRPGAVSLPKDRRGMDSLLHLARTPYAIDRLLELGESRHARDYWNETPVGAMCKLGTKARGLVRHLQKRGFQVRPEEFARLGDLESLAELHARDPSFVRHDEVLMKAIDSGSVELVGWLLERGASANARTTFGSQCMALHSAAWNGNLAIAKLLVAAGADLRGLDVEHRNTPAGYARVARRITNNPDCDAVAEYLEQLEKRA